jgi:hypothetical protein
MNFASRQDLNFDWPRFLWNHDPESLRPPRGSFHILHLTLRNPKRSAAALPAFIGRDPRQYPAFCALRRAFRAGEDFDLKPVVELNNPRALAPGKPCKTSNPHDRIQNIDKTSPGDSRKNEGSSVLHLINEACGSPQTSRAPVSTTCGAETAQRVWLFRRQPLMRRLEFSSTDFGKFRRSGWRKCRGRLM